MKNMLVFVDKNLIVPVAVKLLGSSITIGKKVSAESGFDWFFLAKMGIENNKEIQANIVDFFAEDVFDMAYSKILEKCLDVRTLCNNVQSMKYKDSDIVSIKGRLEIPGIGVCNKYNPFDPPDITLSKVYKINGNDCFIGAMIDSGYKLPIYFPFNSKEMACYCVERDVEIVGILKWSPTYEVGAYAMNQTLLCVALLLQR
jgi:hypothetical protein